LQVHYRLHPEEGGLNRIVAVHLADIQRFKRYYAAPPFIEERAVQYFPEEDDFGIDLLGIERGEEREEVNNNQLESARVNEFLQRLAINLKLPVLDEVQLKLLKAVRLFLALDMSDEKYRRYFRQSEWCDANFPMEWRTLKARVRKWTSNHFKVRSFLILILLDKQRLSTRESWEKAGKSIVYRLRRCNSFVVFE
jgi:hypothetical protein